MKELVVVIPIYKEEIDYYDIVSLTQVKRVLSDYEICLIAPKSLNIENYSEYSSFVERFDDYYFESPSRYSRLCLTEDLYNRFIDYEYILIYQLDAFVFFNSIKQFIGEYDYIGAPLSNNTYWKNYHVGNGGLSLRKTKKCVEMIRTQLDKVLELKIYRNFLLDYEDHFWSFCGANEKIDFKVPSIEVAAQFALQDDSCNVYRLMKQTGLPFGIHMWHGSDFNYWRPVIESYGYQFNDIVSNETYEGFLRMQRIQFFCEALLKTKEGRNCIKNLLFPEPDTSYYIWGRGRYGKYAITILKKIGVNIIGVIDNVGGEGERFLGINVVSPDNVNIKSEEKVIIAVKNYTSIVKQCKQMGKSRNIIIYSDLEKHLVEYVQNNNNELKNAPEWRGDNENN